MPGGAALSGDKVLEQLQAALAPLAPIFVIANCLTNLVTVLEAAPEIPVNPAAFINALDTFINQCVPNLATLVPAIAAPQMLKDILDCLINALGKIREQIIQLQAIESQLLAYANYLEGSEIPNREDLRSVLQCSEELSARNYENLSSQLEGINQIIALVRLFGVALPGFPTIPDFSALQSAPINDALFTFDSILTALVQARALIP
jgi:hypothetical protein